MHFYRVAGLSVASEIDLPSLIDMPEPVAAPDVTIRLGVAPESLEGARSAGPNWQIGEDRFLMRVPGVARFHLIGGSEIIVDLDQGPAAEGVAIFITGTVFGILLHQRRQVVLHASALLVGGKAVLFCGASGAGKSTIAAALVERGYPLVTDDLCAIRVDANGAPLAYPDGRQLKLREQAIEQLGLAEQQGGPIRPEVRKYYVSPTAVVTEAAPLAAVYALRELRAPLTAGIEPANVVDAALIIRRNAYRPRLVQAMEQRKEYFATAAAIAGKAGVFTLTRPMAFEAMGETLDDLEAQWRERGLIGAKA